jgi:outer membrane protein TolC
MNKNLYFRPLSVFLLLIWWNLAFCQTGKETTKLKLTFNEVIKIAREQAPQAIMAKNHFLGSYWQYRTYKAERLPGISFNSTLPDFNRSIGKVTQPDGSEKFVSQNSVNTGANVSLNQNIPFSGGNFYVSSGLQRNDNLTNQSKDYLSNPFNIGITQPLNGFNGMRWSKKIEPLKYEEAKKRYCSALEDVSSRAINLFFDLALAQLNFDISKMNRSNADTLYKIAMGRYNIGTIPENELLQMELGKLNAETAYNQSRIDLVLRKSQIRSFLGYNDRVEIEIVLTDSTPKLELNYDTVLTLALQNNPNIIQYKIQMLEADKNVALARSEKGLKANLFASYGQSGSSTDIPGAYSKPQEQQKVQVGFTIPILDWGMQKGKYKMAQSNREITRINVEQANIDFQQDVFMKVMQFNLQNEQMYSASKADTVAQMRFNVIKHRFLIGKINITDLNIAIAENDAARRGHISAVRNFWNLFYDIRKTTLFDFVENKPITENFDELVK